MSFTIVHYNDPVLRKKGEKITTFDAAFATLAARMVEAMHAHHGIGLAAQQIGKALQLCVVDVRPAEADFNWILDGAKPPLDLFMPMAVANPKITVIKGTDDTIAEEGCLSFPNIRADVERPDAIEIHFQDERGVPHVLQCDGLLARCLQHEVDHLNGVLFIDRMTKKVRATVDEPVKALAKQTREEKRGTPPAAKSA
ncbi:MAG: peptide deformylase [Verrucomicrobia bacterium]|nr:peptide deformylase [Verrucomicrobiota bacterium]